MRELSIAEHSRFSELPGVHLLEHFAGCGKRLDKNSLFVADGIWHGVQILKRQRQILRERTVVRHDAKHSAPRAMRF